MILTRRHTIVVLVLPLALAACGGSSKKVDPAADLAVAKGAVLTSADLPGYTGKPHRTPTTSRPRSRSNSPPV